MNRKVSIMACQFLVCLMMGISTASAAGLEPVAPPGPGPAGGITTATFVSATGEQLTTFFCSKTDSAILTLPDGSTTRLPRAMSGSGARYADDRMIFWEHQGEASVWIGEKLIFKGAAAKKP